MRFKKGKPYFIVALDHSGHLGNPKSRSNQGASTVECWGRFVRREKVDGVSVHVFFNAGAVTDPDTWGYSRILTGSILKAVLLPDPAVKPEKKRERRKDATPNAQETPTVVLTGDAK